MPAQFRDRLLDSGYRRLVRPALFRSGGGDPEVAHERSLRALATVAGSRTLTRLLAALCAPSSGAERTVFGVRFPNPVGVAAGLDKDARALAAWPALGFGFVEAGTVTAVPQPGNDRPRLFRLPASGAIINRMGFNNAGAAALAARADAGGRPGDHAVPLGVSIGKSRVVDVDRAIGDYLTSLRAVHQVADYLAVNVSSPNTPGLRGLQDAAALTDLLATLIEEADRLAEQRSGRRLPICVKIAPDLTDAAIGELLQVCTDRGVAGIIATNTTLTRDHLAAADLTAARERGGLSGEPLRGRALEVVRFVAGHSELPVIGVGGISQPAHALAMFDAGARLVQLYTGFIYSGPALVREIVRRSTEPQRGAAGAASAQQQAAEEET